MGSPRRGKRAPRGQPAARRGWGAFFSWIRGASWGGPDSRRFVGLSLAKRNGTQKYPGRVNRGRCPHRKGHQGIPPLEGLTLRMASDLPYEGPALAAGQITSLRYECRESP